MGEDTGSEDSGSLVCGARWKAAYQLRGGTSEAEETWGRGEEKREDTEPIWDEMSLKCLWDSHVKIPI